MANDINIWNDIDELEKLGNQEHAKDLLKVYTAYFIEETPETEREQIRAEYENKYQEDLKI